MQGFLSLDVIGAALLLVLLLLIARRLKQGRSILYPFRLRGPARADMKVYLDIDGTLIHEELGPDFGKPAAGLEEFLRTLRYYDVYWLTTHCMDGDPTRARRILKEHTPENVHSIIENIKPTAWRMRKSEALDFGSNFIWFENDPSPEDLAVLAEYDALSSLVEVDLRMRPNQLREIARRIL